MNEIYKIQNNLNGKVYIGQTTLPGGGVERFKNHIWTYHSGMIKNHLYNAIRKWGEENFSIEILESGIESKELLDQREQWWIKKFDSTNPEKGYNLTIGGEGGNTYQFKSVQEMKGISKKISEARKGSGNWRSCTVDMKDLKTNEVFNFESAGRCIEYVKSLGYDGLNQSKIKSRISQNQELGRQTMFCERFIFKKPQDEFGTYTNYKVNWMGAIEMISPSNESFIGMNLKDCAEHFNEKLKETADFEKKGYKIRRFQYEHKGLMEQI